MQMPNNRFKFIIFDSGKRIVKRLNRLEDVEKWVAWANNNSVKETKCYLYDFATRDKAKYLNFSWYLGKMGSNKFQRSGYLQSLS